MKNYMWAVHTGLIYHEGFVTSVYDRKQDAERDIRANGCRFDKKQGIFVNDRQCLWWYEIKKVDRNVL